MKNIYFNCNACMNDAMFDNWLPLNDDEFTVMMLDCVCPRCGAKGYVKAEVQLFHKLEEVE